MSSFPDILNLNWLFSEIPRRDFFFPVSYSHKYLTVYPTLIVACNTQMQQNLPASCQSCYIYMFSVISSQETNTSPFKKLFLLGIFSFCTDFSVIWFIFFFHIFLLSFLLSYTLNRWWCKQYLKGLVLRYVSWGQNSCFDILCMGIK